MSSLVYPTLPGLSIELSRAYVWKTGYQEALSGKQSTVSYRQYPLVNYQLVYNVLRDIGAPAFSGATSSEILAIVGLFNQVQGRWDTFLFTDPEFNTITTADAFQFGVFGTGTGSQLTFQLIATYTNPSGPGQPEIIQNLNGTPILYDNGSVISNAFYTIGPTGIITFASGHAPASGHTLTWTGSFYYRCRFDEDSISWKRFMTRLWSATVKFTSVKL